jgi:aspartate carbamoyltransferase catalytic subunit
MESARMTEFAKTLGYAPLTLTSQRTRWQKDGLHSITELSRKDICDLFLLAEDFRAHRLQPDDPYFARGLTIATLFFENSTRTRFGFEAAAGRIGASVIPVAIDDTRMQNGESLLDTVQAIGSFVDALIIRHSENNVTRDLKAFLPTPIINAGDGTNEHPTQALLDLYTIWREFKKIDGLKILVMNDAYFARSAHSLLLALNEFSVDVGLMVAEGQSVPPALRSQLNYGIAEVNSPANFQPNVIYLQPAPERWLPTRERARSSPTVLTSKILKAMPPDTVVLHPGSRGDECPDEVAYGPQSRMKCQNENGLYLRMAVLAKLLSRD